MRRTLEVYRRRPDWETLLFAALCDFIHTWGTAVTSAMLAMGEMKVPSTGVLFFCTVSGLVMGVRTIRQMLDAHFRGSFEKMEDQNQTMTGAPPKNT